MKRTRLKDRKMPVYTRGEEIFNMTSHIVGGGMGVIYLVTCVLISAFSGSAMKIVASSIYGASVIALFSVSSVYHGLHQCMGKRVMQVLDHCSIYLMIAGTYTPFALCALRPEHPVLGWIIFGLVWGIAATASVFTAIDLNKYKYLSMASYITMGWCILIFAKVMFEILTLPGTLLLLIGGVLYMIGIIYYVKGVKRRYSHSVFHIFVNLGSLLHFLCIVFYVLL
ncbi:MAG: hemolysin III family protein [Clostridia bacterium]|nr:hemolysin III family protein [Clostridia bacterium]